MALHSPYNSIAGMYHALWFDWYLPAAMPALETLFFSRVPQGTTVLDLCCGSGHVTKELVKRGYRVTGLDNSSDLIQLASKQLPRVEFFVQDVRNFSLSSTYHAALCTFDSLNHLLTLSDLQQAFHQIHRHLDTHALFVYDMNLTEAYELDLKQWAVDIHDNSVGLVRGQYDPVEQRAKTELMWFSRSEDDQDCWRQKHSIVEQRCYQRGDILGALANAGFHDIQSWMAVDLGVSANLGYGRMFVSATA